MASNTENAIENNNGRLARVANRRGMIGRIAVKMQQRVYQIKFLFSRSRRWNLEISSHLLVCILQFKELYFIMTAFILTIVHATGMAGVCGRFSKFYGRACLPAHAIMNLQHQSAGDSQVHAGNQNGQDFFHDAGQK